MSSQFYIKPDYPYVKIGGLHINLKCIDISEANMKMCEDMFQICLSKYMTILIPIKCIYDEEPKENIFNGILKEFNFLKNSCVNYHKQVADIIPPFINICGRIYDYNDIDIDKLLLEYEDDNLLCSKLHDIKKRLVELDINDQKYVYDYWGYIYITTLLKFKFKNDNTLKIKTLYVDKKMIKIGINEIIICITFNKQNKVPYKIRDQLEEISDHIYFYHKYKHEEEFMRKINIVKNRKRESIDVNRKIKYVILIGKIFIFIVLSYLFIYLKN